MESLGEGKREMVVLQLHKGFQWEVKAEDFVDHCSCPYTSLEDPIKNRTWDPHSDALPAQVWGEAPSFAFLTTGKVAAPRFHFQQYSVWESKTIWVLYSLLFCLSTDTFCSQGRSPSSFSRDGIFWSLCTNWKGMEKAMVSEWGCGWETTFTCSRKQCYLRKISPENS